MYYFDRLIPALARTTLLETLVFFKIRWRGAQRERPSEHGNAKRYCRHPAVLDRLDGR